VSNLPEYAYEGYRTPHYEAGEHSVSLLRLSTPHTKTISFLEVMKKNNPLPCDREEVFTIQYTVVGEAQGSVDVMYLVSEVSPSVTPCSECLPGSTRVSQGVLIVHSLHLLSDTPLSPWSLMPHTCGFPPICSAILSLSPVGLLSLLVSFFPVFVTVINSLSTLPVVDSCLRFQVFCFQCKVASNQSFYVEPFTQVKRVVVPFTRCIACFLLRGAFAPRNPWHSWHLTVL